MPVGLIAEKAGYSTHNAFTANFKRLFCVLPSQYREKRNIRTEQSE